jgi:hypothetical protein
MMKILSVNAFKEWQVAVHALELGETILLLRKGGIRELGERFQVQHDRVVLYPTYEHQTPTLLKPEYASLVQPVESGWHPETVSISAWAEITDVWQTSDPTVVADLLPFHIWNECFIRDRLQWQPQKPLYLLLLRVYRLASAQPIPFIKHYGGCKSWIELEQAIALDDSQPVLSTDMYQERVNRIRSVISPSKL